MISTVSSRSLSNSSMSSYSKNTESYINNSIISYSKFVNTSYRNIREYGDRLEAPKPQLRPRRKSQRPVILIDQLDKSPPLKNISLTDRATVKIGRKFEMSKTLSTKSYYNSK